MHREELVAVPSESVNAGIVPNVGSVAAMRSEVNVVDVRRGTVLEDEYEFVLGAIKRAHAGVGLPPHADVFQLIVGSLTGCKYLRTMPPVHKDILEGPVAGVRTQPGPERNGQQRNKLSGRHFAGGHRELSVLDFTRPTDMAIDADIVGRVGNDQSGLVATEYSVVGPLG